MIMPNPIFSPQVLQEGKRAALLRRGPASPIPQNKAIFDMFLANFSVAGFPPTVMELATPQLLLDARSRIASLGLHSLAEAGTLAFKDHLSLGKPGLIISSAARPQGVTPLPMPVPDGVQAFVVPAWPITESVIIADELDLRDKTLIIDANTVSCLWIIVRRLRASHGATITFSPLANPTTVPRGIDAQPNPAEPNYARDVRPGCDEPEPSSNGGDGAQGGAGYTGAPGFNAPLLFICALEVDAMPDIVLPGQKGGRGGPGGWGADGGCGQRGRDCHSTWFDCKKGPGRGGQGGRGGDGGKGGRGGNGGNGGCISFAMPGDIMPAMMTARKFIANNAGGEGGDPGGQGEPGNGGPGGDAGYAYDRCEVRPERAGAIGLPGQKTGDLGRGRTGNPGDIAFSVITEEDWLRQFTQTWIISVQPSVGWPGESVTLTGSNFTSDLRAEMMRGGSTGAVPLATTFKSDQEVSARIPDNALAGRVTIQLTSAGRKTENAVPFTIRPKLLRVIAEGKTTGSIYAGQTVQLVGRGFTTGISVTVDGKTLKPTATLPQMLTVDLPSVLGEDPGGATSILVTTTDGLTSDPLTVQRLPVVDNGFRAKVNGFAFRNFKKGQNVGLDTYAATFGSDEVALEMLLDPITSAAYYAFFHYFLTNFGHCTGFSTCALDRYHRRLPTFAEGPNTAADPPDIPKELMHQINVAQGRTLSRESIYFYAEQSKQGIARVERSVREIEANLKQGFGTAGDALVLSFIPSGTVWDMVTDPEIREALVGGHCVVPTRIVYPDLSRSLDGAKLYIYNCNEQGSDDQYIRLFQKEGKISFDYPLFSPDNGFTLGTAPLQKELYDDVDVPFAELQAGEATVAFIVEFVLSPAFVSVADAQGRLLGYRDGKVHASPHLGWIRPGLENLLMVRSDAVVTERLITGIAEGTYQYGSVQPGNRSVVLSDVHCTANTRDRVVIKPDLTEVRFVPSETKTASLHICAQAADGTSRALSIEASLQAGESLALRGGKDLLDTQIDAPVGRPLKVKARIARNGRAAFENARSLTPEETGRLVLPPDMWPADTPVLKLATPTPISPAEGEEFSIFPRNTTLTWRPVQNATGYRVMVEYGYPTAAGMAWASLYQKDVLGTSWTFQFVGAQPGRWCVTAMDSTGVNKSSEVSAWRYFRYKV
jgi:hypothetical protein